MRVTSGLRITPGLRVRSGLRVTPGLRRPGEVGFVGPLDLMGISPILGISPVYRLTGTSWGVFEGVRDPLRRILRESDNDEANFSFDEATNRIDTAAVEDFLNGAVGRDVGGFDQTGNGQHATQSTPTSAPVYAGEDGWDFGGASDTRHLDIAHSASQLLTAGLSVFAQINQRSGGGGPSGGFGCVLHKATAVGNANGFSLVSRSAGRVNGGVSSGSITSPDNSVPFHQWRNVEFHALETSGEIFVDGSSVEAGSVSSTTNITATVPIRIGAAAYNPVELRLDARVSTIILGPAFAVGDTALLGALEKPA